MPPVPVPVIAAYAIAGGDLLVLGRLYKVDGSHNLVPVGVADVTSISRTIVSLADGTTVLSGPTSLVVATTILSALSTGTIWTQDILGFNVVDQIPGALLVQQPGVEVRYAFTLTGGTVVPLAVQIDLKAS